MNNHKTACVVLVALMAALIYGVGQFRTMSVQAKNAFDNKTSEAETAESAAQLANIQLKTLDSKTAELRKDYKEWQQHFEKLSSPQDTEHVISNVVRAADVFVISQKFSNRSNSDKDSTVRGIVIGDLVVEDDYGKAMNWLGKIEETIPQCRVTKCNIRRGDRGNDIHLEIRIEVPLL